MPPLNTEARRLLSLRPVSNGPQQCRIIIRMDVSRHVAKTVASRSANWTASIIRTTATSRSTLSHSALPFNDRGIATLPSNFRHGRHNSTHSNTGYLFTNKSFCHRGLQTNLSTKERSQSTHVSHREIPIDFDNQLMHYSWHRKEKTLKPAV